MLDADLETTRPATVVLETMGDALTPCIENEGSYASASHLRATMRDVRRFVRTARDAGARVVLVAPLPIGGQAAPDAPAVRALDAELRRLARSTAGVSVVDGPRDAVAPDGRFVATLPCAPDEVARPDCRDGAIAVRDAYFGIHLCPAPYLEDAAIRRGCPGYSSGAVRYGRALADVVAAPRS